MQTSKDNHNGTQIGSYNDNHHGNHQDNRKDKQSRSRVWKKSAGFVMAFILFLGICGIFFSLDLWLGFLNKQSVVTAVADSQYSDRAYEQMSEDLEALMKAHSLESEPALALLDENEFYAASGGRISATLKGNTARVDTRAFQGDLTKEINLELTSQGVPLTTEIKQAIKEIAFTAGSLYDNHTYFQFGEQFYKARKNMVPQLRFMLIVSLGIAALMVVLLSLFYRKRHAALSYINYALFGSVLANLLVVGLLYITNPIGETGAALYYQNFIDYYLSQSLVPGVGLSAIGLIVIGVLWVSIRRIQKEE